MQQVAAAAVTLFSILFPAKTWYAPVQPLNVTIKANEPLTLVLTDFTGKPFDPRGSPDVDHEQTVDLRELFPPVSLPGTYLLFAIRRGKIEQGFLGTPLVIEVRSDRRPDAPNAPMVIKIEPLRYAVITTDRGQMTCVFYYDTAPDTVTNFLSLAEGGFYDGLTFHRILPGYIVEGGDPRGDGTGGPGYHLEAEFSDRQHLPGVLSMARQVDPIERQGSMPRSEYANSAGSQFFICLDYANTKPLDHRYTAFGQVVDGMGVVQELGQTPVGRDAKDQSSRAPLIRRVEVFSVRPGASPYREIATFWKGPTSAPTTAPITAPTTEPATAPTPEPAMAPTAR
jgi:cyclophilin family peptidyl-prolyl cis-trans isomerase